MTAEQPTDKALMLAELVSRAFRLDDAAAMRAFGSNAAAFLARDVEHERSAMKGPHPFVACPPEHCAHGCDRCQYGRRPGETLCNRPRAEHATELPPRRPRRSDELGPPVTVGEVRRAITRDLAPPERFRSTEPLVAALRLDRPWTAADVLHRLADAARHLLGSHACDVHGHEEIARAASEAVSIAGDLRALVFDLPPLATDTPAPSVALHAPAVAAWLEGRGPFPEIDPKGLDAWRASRPLEAKADGSPPTPATFELEHALREAADAIARAALSAMVPEGGEIAREAYDVATSRVFTELNYRARVIARALPGSERVTDRLVAFLYLLMRDEVTSGALEEFIAKIEGRGVEQRFSAQHLEAYARELAARLA